ncbi:DUF6098 family protein [Brevibacterium renqingii]|uniref:DUF6098 family protein n=1 Tax=Brevibacterium renqingii TaxID=2776916 RepID=UPI001FE91B4B|nr:DUF6098 family protein [Brevibacterium renqingii]
MLESLAEVEELAATGKLLYVRYSEGYESDSAGGSIDTESGLELPGLAVNPLTPEAWWTRPLGDWLARQLCQYKHLQEKNPDRFAWILSGTQVGRGPDCEPLLSDVEPIARLSPRLLDEAERRYRENFDAEKGPEDAEDADDKSADRTKRDS